jgi:hypothetical protein
MWTVAAADGVAAAGAPVNGVVRLVADPVAYRSESGRLPVAMVAGIEVDGVCGALAAGSPDAVTP